MKTLNTYEEYGITPSYKTGHISENAYSNLKRKGREGIECKTARIAEEQRPEKRQKIEGELEKKQRAEERARKAFEKQHAERNLCIEPYSVFVLALALTKDVEWRGSATKLERGCSSFIVFWETGLHSTQTDEGTAAETWLRWAGVMQQMRPSGQVHVMQYWAGWIASLVAERALDLFHAAGPTSTPRAVVLGYGVLRSQHAARLCGRLDLCRGTGGVEAAPVQSGGMRQILEMSTYWTHSSKNKAECGHSSRTLDALWIHIAALYPFSVGCCCYQSSAGAPWQSACVATASVEEKQVEEPTVGPRGAPVCAAMRARRPCRVGEGAHSAAQRVGPSKPLLLLPFDPSQLD
ncbi:hypothetical protein B0H14DRAFT_2642038 [Mycena olivaceomarginata]|nr:hypothetical protein B0H14DRAFT_2642038 [Mycena olivaceomarginata]